MENFSPNEIQVIPGIYYTPAKSVNKNKSSAAYVPSNNIANLEIEYEEFIRRISELHRSIKEIREVDNWDEDTEFRSAVLENYGVILKTLNNIEEISKKRGSINEGNSEILSRIDIAEIQVKRAEMKSEIKEVWEVLHKADNEGVYL